MIFYAASRVVKIWRKREHTLCGWTWWYRRGCMGWGRSCTWSGTWPTWGTSCFDCTQMPSSGKWRCRCIAGLLKSANKMPYNIINVIQFLTMSQKLQQPQGQHCSKITKPPQSLPLQMAERLRRAQTDSVANHVKARSISDWRALTWLVTETGWARRKRSAICGGKLISVHMIPDDVNRRYGI